MALIAAAYAVYRQTTERPPLFAPYIGAAAGRLHEFLVIWLLLVAALALWRSILLADPEAPLAARLSNWRHLEIALPLAGCLAALPAMLAKTQFQAWLADAQARLDFLFWPTRGVFSVGLVAFSVGGSCGLFVLLPLTCAALAGWAPFFPELAAPADYAQRRTAFISAAWRSGLAAVTLVWAIAFIVLLVTWWPTAPTDRLRVGLAFAFYGAGQVVWMELFRGRVRSLLRLRLAAAADGRPAQLQPSC